MEEGRMITFGGTKHRHRVARVGAIKFYLGWVTTSFQLLHQKGVGNHIADADVPVRFQVVIKPHTDALQLLLGRLQARLSRFELTNGIIALLCF